MDTDSNDNVQNVQLSRNMQPDNLSSQLSTAVNSRSVHPLAASEDYSTSNVCATFLSDSVACHKPSLLVLPTAISDGSQPELSADENSSRPNVTSHAFETEIAPYSRPPLTRSGRLIRRPIRFLWLVLKNTCQFIC